jgi:hypothetical protein
LDCEEGVDKGKPSERAGRKVTGLKPQGYGSGTAEAPTKYLRLPYSCLFDTPQK